jgi:hypothetical protein
LIRLPFTFTSFLLFVLFIISVAVQIIGSSLNIGLYSGELTKIMPQAMWTISIYDPRYSPPLYYLSLLKLENLDYAWVRVIDGTLRIEWAVVIISLAIMGLAIKGLFYFARNEANKRQLFLAFCMIILACVGLAGFSLYQYYDDPRFGGGEDYHLLLNYLKTTARPDDVVILAAGQHMNFFLNYNKAQQNWYTLASSQALLSERTKALLEKIIHRYERIWLVMDNIPEHRLPRPPERWLSENAYKVEEKIFSHFSRLCLFSSPAKPPNPYADKIKVKLGDKIELIGHDFSPRTLKPGGIINISLLWKATSPIEDDYTVFVQLLDEEGFLRAQIDSYPVAGFRPTSSWLEGEVIRDNYGLMLPSDLPPGDYNLICGMYLLRTMERLPIFDKDYSMKGDYVHLGVVSIEGF